jgi:hypothetical protein
MPRHRAIGFFLKYKTHLTIFNLQQITPLRWEEIPPQLYSLEETGMKKSLVLLVALFMALLIAGCDIRDYRIVVNSLEDVEELPQGMVTLRSALDLAEDGEPIVFHPSLDGGTIELSIVGEEATVLPGEVMGMRDEPSGPVSYLEGYFHRNYGKSALYARKNVIIDASALPHGITLSWVGGSATQARVLAVYGDLTMINVSVTGGRSVAEEIVDGNTERQPWTLGRGGGVAVWGKARLVNCKLYNNYCEGDFASSRDRGAFGGGLYADIVDMENCIVSGNSVLGGGAAGGGVFSVGGRGVTEETSTIKRSSITGNRISGLFTYGGGVYSDGGGIGKLKTLELTNCTIARNIVDPASILPSFILGIGYWRGGGVYMSNGNLLVNSCTVVENEVYGLPRTDDLGKPNLAGGIAATIGNAHAAEHMTIGHSVIAGNTVHEIDGTSYNEDIFTGSLLYFHSMGYNRIGIINFDQILVPVGETAWASLCRKHYPKEGDSDGVDVADVLNLDSGITHSDVMLSAGVDAPNPVVLHYEPQDNAIDQVPVLPYSISEIYAEYSHTGTDNFLDILLGRIEDHYGLTGFASNFTADFETFLKTVDIDDETEGPQPYTDPAGIPILTLADAQWFGPKTTWPKELPNYPYIEFWHRLDVALRAKSIPGMGPELLGDDAWATLFSTGPLVENGDIIMSVTTGSPLTVSKQEVDQNGT